MDQKEFKKIPDHAKLVFKGIMHDVYQWDQKLFDGSFTTFETLRKRDGVNVVAITEDGKIIINYEEQPFRGSFISLPAGLCEAYGSVLENAKRELEEETGYTSDDWEEWMKIDPLNYRLMEWWTYFFIARVCKMTGKVKLDPGEKIETKFYSYEEFLSITQDEKFRNKEVSRIIKEILNSENIVEEKEKFRKFLFKE